MYISAHISYNGKSAEIDFPISDEMLNEILEESGMSTDTTGAFFVEDIHYPLELSMLNAKDINLDELNFLAKRLDSFTDDEIEQFYVATGHENPKTLIQTAPTANTTELFASSVSSYRIILLRKLCFKIWSFRRSRKK